MATAVPQEHAIADIRKHLRELADPACQSFNAKLIPGVDSERILGVRMPALRAYAKELKRDTAACAAFLSDLPHCYVEEANLHGLLINFIRDADAAVAALDAFLPHVDNWATCDLLKPMAFVRAERDAPGRAFLEHRALRWMGSSHTYTRRYGISMLMVHLLGEGFRAEQLTAAAALPAGDYYVDMMVAWYVATALVKRWDDAIPLLEEHVLSDDTHRKAIQKARESRRISSEQKAYLATLRV